MIEKHKFIETLDNFFRITYRAKIVEKATLVGFEIEKTDDEMYIEFMLSVKSHLDEINRIYDTANKNYAIKIEAVNDRINRGI